MRQILLALFAFAVFGVADMGIKAQCVSLPGASSPYARAREGVTRKQHFAERLNLVEQDRSTLRERYRK